MNNENFESYLRELDNHYNNNPKNTLKGLKAINKQIEKKINNKEYIKYEPSKCEIVLIVFVFLIMILLICKNTEILPIFLMGLLFFSAGHFFAMLNKSSLPVLYTHGLVGLILMCGAYLSDNDTFFSFTFNPALLDGKLRIEIYIGFIILLIVCGIIYSTLFSLKNKLREKKYSMLIPFALYLIAFCLMIKIKI